MTQKFEFIATQTIEKPPMKSSTYYSNIVSGRNEEQDLDGRTSFIDDQPTSLPDSDDVDSSAESSVSADVRTIEDHGAESGDDVVQMEPVDEAPMLLSLIHI